MGRASRWEYLRQIHPRYRRASRAEKSRILGEFCKVTGYNRKYALRVLNGPPPEKRPRKRRRRRPIYGQKVVMILAALWEAAGYPWSVRLRALIPEWLPWVRKRFSVSATLERQLLKISARQIDRRLREHKKRAGRRLYGRTKPGSLLKHHVPIKTDHWDVKQPGHTEIDLVSHSGDCATGEFGHTLNVVDIHTTWTESMAVLGKAQVRVQQALDAIRRELPFELKGIDSDNGSEFINAHLVRYCEKADIQFTRGRPYKKDDNAHVEQKNWTHVRKLMGWVRYDSEAAVATMNRLYRGDLRLLQNLFLPSVKLVRKERVGSRVRRRYDAAKTPWARVLECKTLRPLQVARLTALRDRLDPFVLSRSVDAQLERIHALANLRRSPRQKLKATPTARSA
ncbi:MAG TPA: DDE-type integrase/transposase/recombinase [Vicinamibacteria bacterium]|nr:DDE-type integrase/transposase/recombinase [Vicinamibacteria bacterium]